MTSVCFVIVVRNNVSIDSKQHYLITNLKALLSRRISHEKPGYKLIARYLLIYYLCIYALPKRHISSYNTKSCYLTLMNMIWICDYDCFSQYLSNFTYEIIAAASLYGSQRRQYHRSGIQEAKMLSWFPKVTVNWEMHFQLTKHKL